MDQSLTYSAVLTGEPFLYFEIKQVAKLKSEGLSEEEIKQKVAKENLFQYQTGKSVNKMLNAVVKRISVLDPYLVKLLANGPVETSKLVAVYAIMKTNLLFFEFMEEVYKEKISTQETKLENKDFNLFFLNKGEQSETVVQWHTCTLNKLRQVFTRILAEAGLISDIRKKELRRVVVEKELADHLIAIGEQRYLEAIQGGMF